MLYFIGLGLGDAEDVTVKGLKIIKRASRVYLEAYTSILTVGKEALVGDTLSTAVVAGFRPTGISFNLLRKNPMAEKWY
jgi:diphthamide biosynthesis methyltransferase